MTQEEVKTYLTLGSEFQAKCKQVAEKMSKYSDSYKGLVYFITHKGKIYGCRYDADFCMAINPKDDYNFHEIDEKLLSLSGQELDDYVANLIKEDIEFKNRVFEETRYGKEYKELLDDIVQKVNEAKKKKLNEINYPRLWDIAETYYYSCGRLLNDNLHFVFNRMGLKYSIKSEIDCVIKWRTYDLIK